MTQTSRAAEAHPSPTADGAGRLRDGVVIGQQPAARAPAASEIGAAMAHELSGPITALLLYVGEIQQSTARAGDESLKSVVESACREADRIHALILRIGESFEAAAPDDSTINAARNAIAWWQRTALAAGEPRSRTFGQPGTDCSRSGEKSLTRREQEVLRLVTLGHSNKEGAALMKISYRTFECHRAEVMRKFGAKNAAELVRLTMQGEVSPGASLEQPTS